MLIYCFLKINDKKNEIYFDPECNVKNKIKLISNDYHHIKARSKNLKENSD